MNTTLPSPVGLLHEVASIQRMEPGKLCVIRQGKHGPYYNLQCRENGKTVTRYVPREQVELVRVHTANHKKFRRLTDRYAREIIALTRAEREGAKKKAKPSSG